MARRESLPVTNASQEDLYATLVQRSWRHFHQRYLNQKLDDVVVGAVIAANVNQGFQLVDLHSDGSNHYLRFEETGLQEAPAPSRVLFRLQHLSDDYVYAQVQGHLADVMIGYGEPTEDINDLWKELRVDTLQAVLRVQEPGVILFEADLTGKYLYAQVPLFFELDRYLQAPSSRISEQGSPVGGEPKTGLSTRASAEGSPDEGLRVNLPLLVEHINAIVHSLKVYLRGRVGQLRGQLPGQDASVR